MGFFPRTNLEKLDDQIVLHWNRGTLMNVPTGKMLLWNVAGAFPSQETHWIVDDDCRTTSGTSTKLPHWESKSSSRVVTVVGHMVSVLGRKSENLNLKCQVLAMDHDLAAVKNYAIIHGASIVNGGHPLPKNLLQHCDHVIAYADIASEHWLQLASSWRPDVVTISAPCQPWAATGEGKGYLPQVGRFMPESLVVCRKLGVPIIMIEQVPGFPVPPHAKHVLKQIRAFWYTTQ